MASVSTPSTQTPFPPSFIQSLLQMPEERQKLLVESLERHAEQTDQSLRETDSELKKISFEYKRIAALRLTAENAYKTASAARADFERARIRVFGSPSRADLITHKDNIQKEAEAFASYQEQTNTLIQLVRRVAAFKGKIKSLLELVNTQPQTALTKMQDLLDKWSNERVPDQAKSDQEFNSIIEIFGQLPTSTAKTVAVPAAATPAVANSSLLKDLLVVALSTAAAIKISTSELTLGTVAAVGGVTAAEFYSATVRSATATAVCHVAKATFRVIAAPFRAVAPTRAIAPILALTRTVAAVNGLFTDIQRDNENRKIALKAFATVRLLCRKDGLSTSDKKVQDAMARAKLSESVSKDLLSFCKNISDDELTKIFGESGSIEQRAFVKLIKGKTRYISLAPPLATLLATNLDLTNKLITGLVERTNEIRKGKTSLDLDINVLNINGRPLTKPDGTEITYIETLNSLILAANQPPPALGNAMLNLGEVRLARLLLIDPEVFNQFLQTAPDKKALIIAIAKTGVEIPVEHFKALINNSLNKEVIARILIDAKNELIKGKINLKLPYVRHYLVLKHSADYFKKIRQTIGTTLGTRRTIHAALITGTVALTRFLPDREIEHTVEPHSIAPMNADVDNSIKVNELLKLIPALIITVGALDLLRNRYLTRENIPGYSRIVEGFNRFKELRQILPFVSLKDKAVVKIEAETESTENLPEQEELLELPPEDAVVKEAAPRTEIEEGSEKLPPLLQRKTLPSIFDVTKPESTDSVTAKIHTGVQTIFFPVIKFFNAFNEKSEEFFSSEEERAKTLSFLCTKFGIDSTHVGHCSTMIAHIEALFNWGGRIPLICNITGEWRFTMGVVMTVASSIFGLVTIALSKDEETSLVGRLIIKQYALKHGVGNMVRGILESSSCILSLMTLLPRDLLGLRFSYEGERPSELNITPMIEDMSMQIRERLNSMKEESAAG